MEEARLRRSMADSLYLNLWFPHFDTEEMFAHALGVMRQFPFSPQLPGVTNIALYPLSWNEATIFEQRFRPGVAPEEAVAVADGMLHEDYAYVFEGNWDLWTAQTPNNEWTLQPSLVRFIVRGKEFEDGESEAQGEIQVDFGIDIPFLHEELQLTTEVEARVRANVQMLVDFTNRVERNSGTNARLLWSESDENFAHKLVNRLQKVQ
jgi:hypothetical protein